MKSGLFTSVFASALAKQVVLLTSYSDDACTKMSTTGGATNPTGADCGRCIFVGAYGAGAGKENNQIATCLENGDLKVDRFVEKFRSRCDSDNMTSSQIFKKGECFSYGTNQPGLKYYIKHECTGTSGPNIVELAQQVPDLSTLVTAVVAGDLVHTLSGSRKLTVFAPTNEAFAALPAGTLDSLLKPENKGDLKKILEYHVLPKKVVSKKLKAFQEPKTANGIKLPITVSGGAVKVGANKATVIKADNLAINGVVHIIDGVLLPPSDPKGNVFIVNKGLNCADKEKSRFEVAQDQCYSLAAVPTSAVNTDQKVHCRADGGVEITSYKSISGKCSGTGHKSIWLDPSCVSDGFSGVQVVCPAVADVVLV